MSSEAVKVKKDESRARFSAFDWANVKPTIFIIGTGGTGGFTAMNLSRVGYNLHIWDFDKFDQTNLAGQLARITSNNKPKVEEVKSICESLSKDVSITTYNQAYDEMSMTNSIVISCADSMRVRKMAFEKWVSKLDSFKDQPCLFIDTRMLAMQYQVFTVTNDPKRIEAYRTYLFDDNDIPDVDCNSKATTFCGMLVGARVTSILANHLTNHIQKDEDMAVVPFLFGEELTQFNITRYEVKL